MKPRRIALGPDAGGWLPTPQTTPSPDKGRAGEGFRFSQGNTDAALCTRQEPNPPGPPYQGGDPRHHLRHWLQEPASLTARILRHAPPGAAFSVKVLAQHLARPLRDEAALIGGPPRELALARDVVLHLGDRPVVYAHTVVHRDHARTPWHWLSGIGQRPLGGVLFTHPEVTPGPHHYRLLDVRHPLHRQAAPWCGTMQPRQLPARRAVFSLRGSPLLVTEVFLPALFELCPP
ncbi:MAG: chorismate lyase [Rhodocyclaceae bacterium]|nr:MAG: chorismate lyase [Rhodocyclaceae bacterium]